MVSGVWLPGLLTSAHCFQIFIGNCNDMQHDHFEILVNDATPDNAPNVVIDLSDETDESNETDGNDENNVTDESVETDGNDQTHPTYHYPDRMTHPTPQIPSGLVFGAFNSSAMTEVSPRAMDATNRVLQETKLLNIQLIFPSLHSMCDDDNANTTQDTPQVFPSLNLSAEVADGVEPANRCLLCHIKERDSVLGQCGHSNYCFECAQRLWKAPGGGTCPICTTLIENVIQLRL